MIRTGGGRFGSTPTLASLSNRRNPSYQREDFPSMILFYSGSGGATRDGKPIGEPEQVLGEDANLMLSYHLIREGQQCQDKRLPSIVESKRKRKLHGKK